MAIFFIVFMYSVSIYVNDQAYLLKSTMLTHDINTTQSQSFQIDHTIIRKYKKYYIFRQLIANMIKQEVEDMIALATYNENSKMIELNSQALKIIEDFVEAQMMIITFEGFDRKNYNMSQAFAQSKIKDRGYGSFIYMRPKPIADSRTKKQMFFLQISSQSEEATSALHLLCTLISYVVIIAFNQEESLKYLAVVSQRVRDGESQKQSLLNNKAKYKTANLLALISNHGMTESTSIVKDATETLLNKLGKQNIDNQVLSSYPLVKGFQCPQTALLNSSKSIEFELQGELQVLYLNFRENAELMYGPILEEYMKNIVTQVNQQELVDLQKAEDDIAIEPAYEAYMDAIDTYHKQCLEEFGMNPRPDNNELKEILQRGKKRANDQYQERGGSTNPQYRRILNDYISHKDQEIVSAYSSEQRNKNLQILEAESKNVLDKISAKKQTDPNLIRKQIEIMNENYEHQARGPDKYELLNEYMKVFTPIAYGGDLEKQTQLRENLRRNQQLQNRLAALKEQKKKKTCCVIM